MKIHITKHIERSDIPSGSGLARSENNYYVVGDDAAFLFALNDDFHLISKTRLIEDEANSEGRIEKAKKPDFEAMEIIDNKEILIFGSGSLSPQRDLFLYIQLESMQVEKHLLTDFYNSIKALPAMLGVELNIEAVAYQNDRLFLFNRSNNLIMEYEYQQFLNYLQGKEKLSAPITKQYFLPRIEGIQARFSGATEIKGEALLVFTASVENTDNAYDDGEILGSYIGLIDISKGKLGDIYKYCQIPNIQSPLKIESVCVVEKNAANEIRLVLVADNDLGSSTLLEAMLQY